MAIPKIKEQDIIAALKYIDENGVERAMVDDGKVIMSGPDLMGTRAFGQILDPAFNYAA